MPEVVDDTVDTGKSASVDGLKYGAGLTVGNMFLGPIGRAVGGVAAGGNIGGTEGNVLAANAIGTSIERLMDGSGGSSRGRM